MYRIARSPIWDRNATYKLLSLPRLDDGMMQFLPSVPRGVPLQRSVHPFAPVKMFRTVPVPLDAGVMKAANVPYLRPSYATATKKRPSGNAVTASVPEAICSNIMPRC